MQSSSPNYNNKNLTKHILLQVVIRFSSIVIKQKVSEKQHSITKFKVWLTKISPF